MRRPKLHCSRQILRAVFSLETLKREQIIKFKSNNNCQKTKLTSSSYNSDEFLTFPSMFIIPIIPPTIKPIWFKATLRSWVNIFHSFKISLFHQQWNDSWTIFYKWTQINAIVFLTLKLPTPRMCCLCCLCCAAAITFQCIFNSIEFVTHITYTERTAHTSRRCVRKTFVSTRTYFIWSEAQTNTRKRIYGLWEPCVRMYEMHHATNFALKFKLTWFWP